MDRQQDSSTTVYTKVSLIFKSPAREPDEESTLGAYVCTVPDSQLEKFKEQALQIGGKLEEQKPGYLRYFFDGPGSALAVSNLASPYMFLRH